MKMLLETVSLRDIDVAASPKVRAEIHDEAVEDYTKLYKEKKPMPKPVLCKVGIGHYLVADGMHRIQAMRKAGLTERAFDVFQGSYEDCLVFAASANQVHGVRRSSADKRTAIRSVLSTFPKKTDSEIGDMVSVDHKTVNAVRKELEKQGTIAHVAKRTRRDGKSCPAHAGNSQRESNGDVDAVALTLDGMGLEVPDKALAVWNRRQEAQELLTAISRVKVALAKALEQHDPLYAEVSNTVIADLDRVYGSLSTAKPYTVCPRCQGKLPENCTTCKQRGVISKFYWDVMIDAETKTMRAKLLSKTK